MKTLRDRGVECYLATNQDNRRAAYLDSLPWLAGLFERRFYSCHLGAMKPNKEYFEAVTHQAALPPESILFVDDKISNVEGARRCGWSGRLALVLQICKESWPTTFLTSERLCRPSACFMLAANRPFFIYRRQA